MPKTKLRKASELPVSSISSSRILCASSVVVGVLVALSVLLWPSLDSSHHSSDSVNTHTGGGAAVERRKYDDALSYKEIAETRVPLILTGTLVDRWPARKHFTTKFLANKIKHVMAHVQEDERRFITFHDNKPLEDFVSERWEDFNVKVNTTLPYVLRWGSEKADPTKGPYLYYTQDVATMSSQFPDVIGYIQPIKELILSEENVQVNLWVGREGLVTHTHYDCSYNFFFQLQGKKRFTLHPPSDPLYLYPCLHPHYGHSQVDILHPDYEQFPLFRSASPTVAEVGPGDMLVVPPFWFHHVETLAESVSVNVWSDAPEYELINQVYSLPIPFEEGWSEREKIIGAKIYVDMILSSLAINPVEFLSYMVTQRYDPLMRSGRLRLNSTASQQLRQLCAEDRDWGPLLDTYKAMFESGVNASVSVLSRITVRATLEICTGNFIEHLVHSVLGLDTLYPFLKHCAPINSCH